MKTRAASDRPETGVAAGQGVGVGPPRPVVHLDPIVLQGQEPPRHPGVRVLGSGHPLERCMVSNEGELLPQEVVPGPGTALLLGPPLMHLYVLQRLE